MSLVGPRQEGESVRPWVDILQEKFYKADIDIWDMPQEGGSFFQGRVGSVHISVYVQSLQEWHQLCARFTKILVVRGRQKLNAANNQGYSTAKRIIIPASIGIIRALDLMIQALDAKYLQPQEQSATFESVCSEDYGPDTEYQVDPGHLFDHPLRGREMNMKLCEWAKDRACGLVTKVKKVVYVDDISDDDYCEDEPPAQAVGDAADDNIEDPDDADFKKLNGMHQKFIIYSSTVEGFNAAWSMMQREFTRT
ncbi:hypothetical protein B0T24DRAFT_598102 [Lasiosphaeria ovina]|uniref:Uncharacterized protein n=1 Tax=Lasiosphaeria ovina TaxID=92902 RepID=A0AAE0MZL4_9PEZI|nr:hypothetical protein B0T24DRAFT_598102 [Lasiosphaeria ovina]